MFNFTLYKRGIKENWKLFAIITAVVFMYTSVIIFMYDPDMLSMLDEFAKAMPEIMAMMGMQAGATSLLGFMSSYLYGFILIVFPMVFIITAANRLVAHHVDAGSMAYLLAAPIKRSAVAFTQLKVLATFIFAMSALITLLQIVLCQIVAPGDLEITKLIYLNLGLFALHIFIGGLCFLCSCFFSNARLATTFGAGIPAFSYVLLMVSNLGDKTQNAKYFTFLSLFKPDALLAGESSAIIGAVILFVGAVVLYIASVAVFSKKDLHI